MFNALDKIDTNENKWYRCEVNSFLNSRE